MFFQDVLALLSKIIYTARLIQVICGKTIPQRSSLLSNVKDYNKLMHSLIGINYTSIMLKRRTLKKHINNLLVRLVITRNINFPPL